MRNICLFGLGLALVLSLAPSLQAQVIEGSGFDASVRTDTAGPQGGDELTPLNLTSGQIRVGRFNFDDGINVAAVYSFRLPDLGSVTDPFLSADLEFTYLSVDPTDGVPDYNADLYGIDRRATGAVQFDQDFFAGPGPDPNATFLQEDILTPTTDLGRINSVDISDYLNDQYEGGVGAEEFVFLRLSPDFDPVIIDSREGYLIASANNGTNADRPVINFTVSAVPEPSSVAVLLLGVSVISTRRRRSR